jgi:hypothetical protein
MSTPLPPPDPFTHHDLQAPSLAVRRRRGRTAFAVVAGAAAMAGLLGIVPTLASASSSPSTTLSTDDGPEPTAPEAPDLPAPDGTVVACGGIEITVDGERIPSVDNVSIDICDDFFAHEFPINEEAMAEFEACMDELTEITDEVPAIDSSGTVTVDRADGPTIYDLGEGDGTITITKSGDDVSVTTSGDVTEVDLPALDDLWEEHAGQFDACIELLPDPPAPDPDWGTDAGTADEAEGD